MDLNVVTTAIKEAGTVASAFATTGVDIKDYLGSVKVILSTSCPNSGATFAAHLDSAGTVAGAYSGVTNSGTFYTVTNTGTTQVLTVDTQQHSRYLRLVGATTGSAPHTVSCHIVGVKESG